MSLSDVGFWFALTFGLANALGTVLGGFAVRPLIERDSRWELWFAAIAYGIAVPLFVISLMTPDASVSVGFMFVANFAAALGLPPVLATVQRVVESDLRATAMAMIVFCSAVFGQGFGALLIGFLSDILAPTFLESSLRIALSITLVIPAWSIVHYLLAANTLQRDDLGSRLPDGSI